MYANLSTFISLSLFGIHACYYRFLCSGFSDKTPFRWEQGTSHLLTLTKVRQEICYRVITLQLHLYGRSVCFEEIDKITKAASSLFMALYIVSLL